MNGIPCIEEKCAGALVASAIGDALGWPNEFNSKNTKKHAKPLLTNFAEWQRRTGGQYWSHVETIRAGEYSDDTQLILAVARSLLSGKQWDTHFAEVELPFWQQYERGGGGAVKRAAAIWGKKKQPWFGIESNRYFEAGGNGAAMRILPHVIAGVRENGFDAVAENIIKNTLITHGHPRAIVGAVLYGYALFILLKKDSTLSFGELVNTILDDMLVWSKFPSCFLDEWLVTANTNADYKQVWATTVKNTQDNLEVVLQAIHKGAIDIEFETLTVLGCFNKSVNGAGDIAAVSAIYLASRYANNPALGIKSAAGAIGSDTDTIASMAGGLLGAICGLEWISAEWKLVQDYECLIRFASFLLSENGSEIVRDFAAGYKKDENIVWERLAIGKCREIEKRKLAAGKTGSVEISTYMTSLGQTIYVKKYTRKNIDNESVPSSDEPGQNDGVYQGIREMLTSARLVARAKISTAISFAMVEAYWETGRLLTEAVGSRAEYGQELLAFLSKRLVNEFGQGFTVANLRNMRQFYHVFSNRYALRSELSWTHYRQLMRIEDKDRRESYIDECIKQGWSSRQLEQILKVSTFESVIGDQKAKNKRDDVQSKKIADYLFGDNEAAGFLELNERKINLQ